MFVPRTEEDGNFGAVRCLDRVHVIGGTVQPRDEFLVVGSSGQNGTHNGRIGYIPRVFSGLRIIKMPAERRHSSAFVLGDDFAADAFERYFIEIDAIVQFAFERYFIEIDAIVQFDMSQVERHHGGIVATHAFYVAAVFISVPADAIHGIIVMSEHEHAFFGKRFQCLEHRERFGGACGHFLFFCIVAGCHCGYQASACKYCMDGFHFEFLSY